MRTQYRFLGFDNNWQLHKVVVSCFFVTYGEGLDVALWNLSNQIKRSRGDVLIFTENAIRRKNIDNKKTVFPKSLEKQFFV